MHKFFFSPFLVPAVNTQEINERKPFSNKIMIWRGKDGGGGGWEGGAAHIPTVSTFALASLVGNFRSEEISSVTETLSTLLKISTTNSIGKHSLNGQLAWRNRI